MKFILKSIIAILIISMTVSAKLRAEETTGTDWGTYDGKNLRARFAFVTPDTTVSGDDYTWGTWCRFNAKTLAEKSATGNYEFGIACDFNEGAPNAEDKKYLTKKSGNVYYLPYRQINTAAQGNGWYSVSRTNRKLHFVFTTDAGVQKMAIIRMPYKTFGDYITKDQLQNTFTGAKNIASAKVNDLSNEKSKFRGNAEDLIANHPYIVSAKKGESAVKAQIAETKKQQEKLKADLKAGETKLAELNKKANEAYTAYEAAKKAYLTQQNANNSITNKLNSAETNIKTAEEGSKNVAETLKKYEAVETDLLAKIDAEAAHMKKMAPNQGTHVDAAVTGAKAYNINDVNTNLKKFQPKL